MIVASSHPYRATRGTAGSETVTVVVSLSTCSVNSVASVLIDLSTPLGRSRAFLAERHHLHSSVANLLQKPVQRRTLPEDLET